MVINVEIDRRVFNDVYLPYLVDMSRTQVFYGGSSSGKSVFIAQRAVMDVIGGGRNYLVCRAVARTIKASVFNEIIKTIAAWGMQSEFSVNQADRVITCNNGYQILFAGLDDVEKIKSITPAKGVITDIWVEEATETTETNIIQLYKRQRGGSDDTPKRMILSFNPVLRSSWIYARWFAPIGWADDQTVYSGDDLTILKTWYVHNRFLTEQDRADLLKESDGYFRDVYTFGNWGVLGDVIFTNWEVADLSHMHDQFTNRRNGLDFGFASDPAGAVLTHYDRARETIYVFGEMYERGLTNDMLFAELSPLLKRDHVVGDSSEPKSITELAMMGMAISGAVKGKDSVNFGIQWLQRQRIVVDKSCINMINELQQYQWRKDKDGNSIRQPVDRNNHLIDALRYAYEQEMLAATELVLW